MPIVIILVKIIHPFVHIPEHVEYPESIGTLLPDLVCFSATVGPTPGNIIDRSTQRLGGPGPRTPTPLRSAAAPPAHLQ